MTIAPHLVTDNESDPLWRLRRKSGHALQKLTAGRLPDLDRLSDLLGAVPNTVRLQATGHAVWWRAGLASNPLVDLITLPTHLSYAVQDCAAPDLCTLSLLLRLVHQTCRVQALVGTPGDPYLEELRGAIHVQCHHLTERQCTLPQLEDTATLLACYVEKEPVRVPETYSAIPQVQQLHSQVAERIAILRAPVRSLRGPVFPQWLPADYG